MTANLIVGYRTRKIEPEVLQSIMPQITPNKGYTDPVKIARDIDDKKEAFERECHAWPYTGTFDCVVIADPQNERIQTWDYAGRGPGGTKPPICLAVASWILKAYPNAWAEDTHGAPVARFIGFNTRTFLKMLGIECSLPAHNRPLPPRMWINSDHRDIEELILPKEFAKVTLLSALRRRRPTDGAAAKRWDSLLETWQEPHVDPASDVWLTTELASQIAYLD